MESYCEAALFVYSPEHELLVAPMLGNRHHVKVKAISSHQFFGDAMTHLMGQRHVVIAASLPDIKRLLFLARDGDFNVGILPSKSQENLRSCYDLPHELPAQMDVALQKTGQAMDLITCNGHIMLFNATVGRLPLLQETSQHRRWQTIIKTLVQLVGLRLKTYQFTTQGGKHIDSAACGCMVVQRHESSLASRLVARDSSFSDGMISLVIAAPMSVADYLNFLSEFLRDKFRGNKVPQTLGYIKSASIEVHNAKPAEVSIDGELATETPLKIEVAPLAVTVNLGESLKETVVESGAVKEQVEVKNLPQGKELSKARNKRIPLLSYASEERFRELFTALREDAKIDKIYITLMVLSTLLATIGLFLSSASVVIGAMLLAPLMAPIVSLAMGIVRRDDRLSMQSIQKIVVGIVIALAAAAVASLLISHKPVTAEMQARLNPTLLDLGVAILAGIAGAYTKSYKEIIQSLAGVAIAVALVPPLAVAGIGLGRGDLLFFFQAFLLFSTNLIGIVFSGSITFRLLGFSPAVRNKKGIAIVLVLMSLITVPLLLSYNTMVESRKMEQHWQHERFIVGGKYLIVEKALVTRKLDHTILFVDILAREPLVDDDLEELKEKLQIHFSKQLIIHARVAYIL